MEEEIQQNSQIQEKGPSFILKEFENAERTL